MTDEAKPKPMARLFFALWPDETVRRQLAAHRPDAGRPVRAENLHITLLFLGSVDRSRQERIAEAAADVLAPPFQLQLDRLEHWRRSRISWLGLSTPPPPLLSLHQQLRTAAETVGIAVEARPYRPHVTLARNTPLVAAQPIEPIIWDAADFCLVESVTQAGGSRYMVQRRWPLQAGVGPAVGGAGATVE